MPFLDLVFSADSLLSVERAMLQGYFLEFPLPQTSDPHPLEVGELSDPSVEM